MNAIEHIEDGDEACPYGKALEREGFERGYEENVEKDGDGGWPWHEWHGPMLVLSMLGNGSIKHHVLIEGSDGDHEATKKYKTPPLLLEFPRNGEAYCS